LGKLKIGRGAKNAVFVGLLRQKNLSI